MIYAGCSGYSFREWVGRFYPPKTPTRKFLSYYASELGSVEINHTFRRFPKIDLVHNWADATPESFRFSFKMHRSVTHTARLKNVGAPVEDFMEALTPLGRRLGVVLFQLPPSFRANVPRLDEFLEELPSGHRYAVEFRHESWNVPEVLECLRRAGVALCVAEAEIGPREVVTTARFAYLRLRKPPPLSEAEIGAARSLLRRVSSEVEDVYLYVKHDDEGHAPQQVKQIQAV